VARTFPKSSPIIKKTPLAGGCVGAESLFPSRGGRARDPPPPPTSVVRVGRAVPISQISEEILTQGAPAQCGSPPALLSLPLRPCGIRPTAELTKVCTPPDCKYERVHSSPRYRILIDLISLSFLSHCFFLHKLPENDGNYTNSPTCIKANTKCASSTHAALAFLVLTLLLIIDSLLQWKAQLCQCSASIACIHGV